MEDWQHKFITRNLPILIEFTSVNSMLLTCLKSKGVLIDRDIQEILSKTVLQDQAHCMLEILMTRITGYEALAIALQKCSQTGAFEVLVNGFLEQDPRSVILSALKRKTEVIKMMDSKTIQIVVDKHKQNYINIFLLHFQDPREFTLYLNTIPEMLPYYVPRYLSNQALLNSDIFKVKCPDVFVFKGIEHHKLIELADGEPTAMSSSQIELKVTSRFIVLENDLDYQYICELANKKVPVHLIQIKKLDPSTGLGRSSFKETVLFSLVASTGDSNILWKYVVHDNKDDASFISEEELLQRVDACSDGKSYVCISNSHGSGKSSLLGSLAHKMVMQHPEWLSVFTKIDEQILSSEETDPISGILARICPNELSKDLLYHGIYEGSISFNVFLDDAFEGDGTDQAKAIDFVQRLTSSPVRLRVFVTSSNNKKKIMEQNLNVIAYNMLPFGTQDQINFLTMYWSHKLANTENKDAHERLQILAVACQRQIQDYFSDNIMELFGAPLHCQLLAEDYFDSARRYSRLSRPATIHMPQRVMKLGNMVKRFIDTKFPSHENSDNKFKTFHCWQALSLYSSELAAGYKEIKRVDDQLPENRILKFGLLEISKDINGQPKVNFVHETFAQYFIVELFCELFYHTIALEAVQEFASNLANLVLNDLFRFENISNKHLNFEMEYLPKEVQRKTSATIYPLKEPVNNLLPVLLECQLTSYSQNQINPEMLETIHNVLQPSRWFQILMLSSYSDQSNIFRFLKNVSSTSASPNGYETFMRSKLTLIKKESESAIAIPSSIILVSAVACLGSGELLKDCVSLYKNCVNEDVIQTMCSMPPYLKNPLHFALSKGNQQAVAYLIHNKVPLDNHCYLYYCVADTYGENGSRVQNRITTCKLLLDSSNNLTCEVAVTSNETLGSPALAKGINLELLKLLVSRNPENALSEVVPREVTNLNYNCVDSTLKYMNAEDSQELCRYLINDIKVPHIFKPKEGHVITLAEMFRQESNVAPETIPMILDVLDPDDTSQNETLLYSAFHGKPEYYEMLLNKGIQVNQLIEGSDSPLHLAAAAGNLPLVKHFLSTGLHNIDQQNALGESALHLAMGWPHVVQYLLEQGANIALPDSKNLTPLHKLDLSIAAINSNSIPDKEKLFEILSYIFQLPQAIDTLTLDARLFEKIISSRFLEKPLLELIWNNCNPRETGLLSKLSAERILQRAIELGRSLDIFKFFIEEGLEYNCKDRKGNTILHWAVRKGKREKLVDYILNALKISPATKNLDGATPLHHTTNWKVVKILLDAGADPYLEDNNGKTFVDVVDEKWGPKGSLKLRSYLFQLEYTEESELQTDKKLVDLSENLPLESQKYPEKPNEPLQRYADRKHQLAFTQNSDANVDPLPNHYKKQIVISKRLIPASANKEWMKFMLQSDITTQLLRNHKMFLIKKTNCTTTVIETCLSKMIISDEEKYDLINERNPIRRNSQFWDLMATRPGFERSLIPVFTEERQQLVVSFLNLCLKAYVE